VEPMAMDYPDQRITEAKVPKADFWPECLKSKLDYLVKTYQESRVKVGFRKTDTSTEPDETLMEKLSKADFSSSSIMLAFAKQKADMFKKFAHFQR
jgi:hypothetical protein